MIKHSLGIILGYALGVKTMTLKDNVSSIILSDVDITICMSLAVLLECQDNTPATSEKYSKLVESQIEIEEILFKGLTQLQVEKLNDCYLAQIDLTNRQVVYCLAE